MGIIAAGMTDIGQMRKNNEDFLLIDRKSRIFIIADGMGGHNGGEIASQMAVNCSHDFFLSKAENLPDENVRSVLIQTVKSANHSIYQKAQENSELTGMGTTIVFALFWKSQLYVANVGDSRAYMINNGLLYQLTRDHSLVQEKINLGIYTRDQGVLDKMKNVLVRTVGYEPNIDVDIFTYQVCKDDIFFFCTDGLHARVSDEEIVSIVNQFIPRPAKSKEADLEAAVNALITRANMNGGHDNVSLIMTVAK
jgi:serine/threonine protein phosphatase PrpC